MSKAKPARLNQVAQKQFGYDTLRPGQEAAIRSLLDGHDTLAVMPTGSGKSAIYQIAAFLIPGCTVVVSPLIALQRDQLKAIEAQDMGEAAAVNSAIATAERQDAFEQFEEGDLEFLFLAPEQFHSAAVIDRLKAAQPSLFVVDEAHCISAWGHDFRPDYLRLGQVIEELGHPRILALTATAAPPVRSEIVERLNMHQPAIVVQGFDRPNIWLSVERFEAEEEKQNALIEYVVQAEKPGIIYAATRKRTEELAEALSEQGVRSQFYHAGMKAEARQQIETEFMQDEIEVLVATTAFGMGVDKPNVRFVCHADISDSLDSYYQEIGRAGRDGEPARAVLLYSPSDLGLRRFFSGSGQVEAAQVEQVLERLNDQNQSITVKGLQEQLDLSKAKLQSILNYLADEAELEVSITGEIHLLNPTIQMQAATEKVVGLQEQRQEFERSRLEMMRSYAEVKGCRREYLLNYFGEKFDPPCNYCDNCKAGIAAETAEHQPYPIDSQVVHRAWGVGTVMRYEGGKVMVLFDRVGYKTIDVQTAVLRRLLQRIEPTS